MKDMILIPSPSLFKTNTGVKPSIDSFNKGSVPQLEYYDDGVVVSTTIHCFSLKQLGDYIKQQTK